jgi:hypothetical protein
LKYLTLQECYPRRVLTHSVSPLCAFAATAQKDLTAENWAREALEDGASNLAKQEAFVRTKSVEDSIKTVKDVSIIKEFCEAWLQELAIVEKRVAAEANAK